jgi:hypothetical protein
MQGDTSINTAGYEQVTVRPIGNLGEGLIELSEFISDTCALDVEHSHDTRLEAAAEQRQRWVRGNAQGLVDW